MTTTSRRAADRAALRDRPSLETIATKQARILGPDDIARMLEAAGPRDAALVALMSAAAARVGETTLLQWGDLIGDRLSIPAIATKTNRGRVARVPAAAMEYLEHWRHHCPKTQRDWMFPGRPVSGPLSTRGAQKAIANLAAELGIEGVSSHSFRRSAITEAHRSGLPLAAIATISGHQDRRSLERYIDAAAFTEAADQARGLLFGQR